MRSPEANLTSKCYKLIGVNASPSMTFLPNGYRGILVSLMKEVQKKFGICYTIDNGTGRPIGLYLPNGTFTGVLDELNKDHEMVIIPTTRTGRDTKMFSMSDFYGWDPLAVAFKYPRVEPDITGFLKPFSNEVWVLLIFAVIACVFVYTFILKMTKGRPKTFDENKHVDTEPMYTGSITIWKVIFGQAFSIQCDIARRLFMGILMMMAFLLINSYKGNLAATLIIPKIVIPFRNIHEMINQNEMGWTVYAGTFLQIEMENAPVGSFYWKLHKGLTKYSYSMKELRHGLVTGEYGVILTDDLTLGFLSRETEMANRCIGTVMEERFMPRLMRIPFKKGSVLMHQFNYVLKRMTEAGVVEKWRGEELKYALRCINNIGKNENKIRALGLADLGAMFFILGSGLALASVIFVVEVMVCNRCTTSK